MTAEEAIEGERLAIEAGKENVERFLIQNTKRQWLVAFDEPKGRWTFGHFKILQDYLTGT